MLNSLNHVFIYSQLTNGGTHIIEVSICHAFFKDQLQFIRSPKAVIERLSNDPKAAFVGFRNVLGIAILHLIAFFLWHMGDATTTAPPFLRIPEQGYGKGKSL